jgi:type I restriction enzyme S subunit
MATKRRIGDILERLKNPIEIQDTEFYTRLTIRINHQGVSVRDNVIGASIGTKSQFYVRAGDFILSKIDARQGAFGIVPPEADGGIITGNFWTYRVDNQLVDINWFLQFTNSDSFLDLCKRSSTGNTHRKYLNESIFLDHVLAIPSLDEQRKSVVACRSGSKQVEDIQHEITHQQSLLAKLTQAILQEAIEGKLTSDWRASHPEVEPARELLERIRAEKASLIAAKKLRPEKPLPKITPAEIPFEIPKGWEWCRFGQIIRSYEAGSSFKCDDREVVGEEWGVIKTSAVTSGNFAERENKFLRADAPADTTSQVAVGDLIFCRASGSKGLAGKCAIVRECSRNLLLSDKTIRVPLMYGISQEYIALHNDSAQAKAYFAGLGMGKSTSMNNVTRDDLFMKPVPLPPLAEQAAIVERVESLMATCRALESEIEQTRTHAAHLLQAVLKEAFAPATT